MFPWKSRKTARPMLPSFLIYWIAFSVLLAAGKSMGDSLTDDTNIALEEVNSIFQRLFPMVPDKTARYPWRDNLIGFHLLFNNHPNHMLNPSNHITSNSNLPGSSSASGSSGLIIRGVNGGDSRRVSSSSFSDQGSSSSSSSSSDSTNSILNSMAAAVAAAESAAAAATESKERDEPTISNKNRETILLTAAGNRYPVTLVEPRIPLGSGKGDGRSSSASSSSAASREPIPASVSPQVKPVVWRKHQVLGKRGPECMRRCISQGILHPVQCHSLC